MNNNTKEKTPVKSPKKRIAIVIGLLFLSWVGYWGVMFFYPIYYGVYGERHQKAKDFGHPERPVEVTVKGKAFGYDVNLDDVLICQGEYNPNFEVSGEYWWLKHPYMYQMNDDGSVLVFPLNGKMVCDEGWRKSLEKTNAIIKAYWFSSIEKPEEIKEMWWESAIKNLDVHVDMNPVNTNPTQKYKVSWKKYFSSEEEKKNFLDSEYANYFISRATIYPKDLWMQKEFLRNEVKDIITPERVLLTQEQYKDLRKLFSNKQYPFSKQSENILKLVVDDSYKLTFFKIREDSIAGSTEYRKPFYKDLANSYAFNIFGYDLRVHADTSDCTQEDKTSLYQKLQYYYFPKEEKIVSLSVCARIFKLPVVPILEEIK